MEKLKTFRMMGKRSIDYLLIVEAKSKSEAMKKARNGEVIEVKEYIPDKIFYQLSGGGTTSVKEI